MRREPVKPKRRPAPKHRAVKQVAVAPVIASGPQWHRADELLDGDPRVGLIEEVLGVGKAAESGRFNIQSC
jgi:hypothetical protein